jgi:hypothetical protein
LLIQNFGFKISVDKKKTTLGKNRVILFLFQMTQGLSERTIWNTPLDYASPIITDNLLNYDFKPITRAHVGGRFGRRSRLVAAHFALY